jgi:hypothetical protein
MLHDVDLAALGHLDWSMSLPAPRMSDSGFAIALDDIGRRGERQILSRWEHEFPLHFEDGI